MTGNEKGTPENSVNSSWECVVCISQIKGCLNSLACLCTIMKFQMKHSVKIDRAFLANVDLCVCFTNPSHNIFQFCVSMPELPVRCLLVNFLEYML